MTLVLPLLLPERAPSSISGCTWPPDWPECLLVVSLDGETPVPPFITASIPLENFRSGSIFRRGGQRVKIELLVPVAFQAHRDRRFRFRPGRLACWQELRIAGTEDRCSAAKKKFPPSGSPPCSTSYCSFSWCWHTGCGGCR